MEREVGFELVLCSDRVGHLIGDIILNILGHPPIVRLLEILHVMRDPVLFIVLLVNHVLVFFVLTRVGFFFDLDLLLLLAGLLKLGKKIILHLLQLLLGVLRLV